MLTRRLLVVIALAAVATFGSFWAASPAGAAGADDVKIGIDHNGGALNINPGPALVVEGGTVDVGLIAIATKPAMGAWEILINYDLTLLDATACTFESSSLCNPAFNSDTQVIVVGAQADPGISGTNRLSRITFLALGSKGSCSNLRTEVRLLEDPVANLITPAVSSGRICIVGCADFNGDGQVTFADGVRLLLHILLRRPYNPTLDTNADGQVDAADFVVWRRQLGKPC